MLAAIVITVNDKYFDFDADEVKDYGGEYAFYLDGVIVAEFMKNNIAGYIMKNYEEEEEEEE